MAERKDITNKSEFDKKDHKDVLVKVAEDLLEVEQNIQSGGANIVTYEKDKVEIIGLQENNFPSFRMDYQGTFVPNGVDIESKGSYVRQKAVPYVEDVENSRFPCGTYSVNVGNKYDLKVGAGGIGIKSEGSTRISTKGRMSVNGNAELNLTSNHNVNITSDTHLNLTSNSSFVMTAPEQVVVNSNLGVKNNAVINGCAFIDGEVFLNHITCPVEVQYTGGGIGSFAQLLPQGKTGGGGMAAIGWADLSYIQLLYNSIIAIKAPWTMPNKVPVFALSDGGTSVASTANGTNYTNPQYSIYVYPHQHPFNNIPLRFASGNSAMRDFASSISRGEAGNSLPVSNGFKQPS